VAVVAEVEQPRLVVLAAGVPVGFVQVSRRPAVAEL